MIKLSSVTISQEVGLGQVYSRLTEDDVRIDKAVFETASGQVAKTGLPQRLAYADVGLDGAVSEAANGQVARLKEDLIKLSSVYHSPRSRAWIKLFLRMPVAR